MILILGGENDIYYLDYPLLRKKKFCPKFTPAVIGFRQADITLYLYLRRVFILLHDSVDRRSAARERIETLVRTLIKNMSGIRGDAMRFGGNRSDSDLQLADARC